MSQNDGEYSPRSLFVYGSGVRWWRGGSTKRICNQNLGTQFFIVFYTEYILGKLIVDFLKNIIHSIFLKNQNAIIELLLT